MYKQGDIILTKFPFSDLSGSKLRPAIIISGENVNARKDFVCLQITSKFFDDEFFFRINEIHLDASLKLESGVRLQKVFTANLSIIDRKISAMQQEYFNLLLTTFKSKVL